MFYGLTFDGLRFMCLVEMVDFLLFLISLPPREDSRQLHSEELIL